MRLNAKQQYWTVVGISGFLIGALIYLTFGNAITNLIYPGVPSQCLYPPCTTIAPISSSPIPAIGISYFIGYVAAYLLFEIF